ncbi:hypothetical protein JCM33374_g2396 [Metschnikowia sp. JCM 33374]|nr:hypothetical protein JCM33374_g2396 [Metschnikowia sp. JCM 33374]
MLHLLTKTLAYFNKRESPVLVTAFKIMNNLLISSATEDSSFSHELIRIGISAALQFAATPVSNLSDQIFVFLNLDSFHRYLSLSKLPKLISAPPIEHSHESNDTSRLGENDAIITYNLEMLIYALINRFTMSASSLGPEDLGLCDFTEIRDWYHLRKIYLASQNTMSWLLASALSRLISSYYAISSLQPSIETQDCQDVVSVANSYSANSYKRQKLHDRQMDLHRASTPAQFYNSLISSEESKLQKCGLQLLSFYYELHQDRVAPNLKEHAHISKQSSFAFNEPTVFDEDFQSNVNNHPETLSILSNAVRLVANGNHSFWGLVVCRGLLGTSDFQARPERPTLTRGIYQLTKLSLDLLKDADVCQLACSVFDSIVFSQSPASLKNLIDSTMMNQLENIAELSELLGPASINLFAMGFWQALAHTYVILGSRKRSKLSKDIAKWLIEKWNTTSEKLSVNQLEEVSTSIPQILILASRQFLLSQE